MHTYLFAKNCKLHKFATINPSRNIEKSIMSDMHHYIT